VTSADFHGVVVLATDSAESLLALDTGVCGLLVLATHVTQAACWSGARVALVLFHVVVGLHTYVANDKLRKIERR
jgi:hypothetical protein